MGEHRWGEAETRSPAGGINRRRWMDSVASSIVGVWGACSARSAETDPHAEETAELQRAEARTRRTTSRPLRTLKSAHYQAIGDASESFMKLTLSDCERLAADFLRHFQTRGFDVKWPDRRLTVIVFRDERPFLRLAENTPPGTMGFFSLSSNWLALFDFRNMPMFPFAPGQTNMETLSHEATHQLSFNTGLLSRRADVPLSVTEGLAMYCERRKLFGATEPGQPNLRRLEELAHTRRRQGWIPVSELLTDDRGCFRRTADRLILSYSESWVMVYHLMNDPTRLPQFRTYLETLRTRNDANRRLDDARSQFGDLARLDEELRQEAIRLQQSF